jgi:hypothetical protein
VPDAPRGGQRQHLTLDLREAVLAGELHGRGGVPGQVGALPSLSVQAQEMPFRFV